MHSIYDISYNKNFCNTKSLSLNAITIAHYTYPKISLKMALQLG